MESISPALHEFFTSVVDDEFRKCNPRVNLPHIKTQVVGILERFIRADQLVIRNAAGEPFDNLYKLIEYANPHRPDGVPSFDWERRLRKDLGDITLFLMGMYPEARDRWRYPLFRGIPDETLRAVGQESYHVVGSFNLFEYEREAMLFEELSEKFVVCIFAFNGVRERIRSKRIFPH